jgi:chromosome segregation ATPase
VPPSFKTAQIIAEAEMTWCEWVDARMDNRFDTYSEAVGKVLGEFRAQAREHCNREIEIVKRELELTRRELNILREEVGLERGLRDLRSEVAKARKQVPKVPSIAARLEAQQTRLQRELDATKQKVSRLRVDQSITDHGLSELGKQMATAKAAASIEMELETSSTHFVMRNIDPAAAKALREFASQVIDARDGGAVWLSDPVAGTA